MMDTAATLPASFRFAIDGVLRTLLTQRNMNLHWLSGSAVMIVGMALSLQLSTRLILLSCVIWVLALETLNTALEALVDLCTESFHRLALVAKDAAAGAVLLPAAGAGLVLLQILVHRWAAVEAVPEAVARSLLFGLPLLGAEAALLWLPRRAFSLVVMCAIALAAAAMLAAHSKDLVSAIGIFAFVLGAGLCRLREPALRTD